MKWEVGKFDRQTIIIFQFLDTPGDEVAPGSDKVGKDFENKRFRHKSSFRRVQSSKFNVKNASDRSSRSTPTSVPRRTGR